VPPGLAKTLNRLLVRTSGALALVSGRSLNDIDLIFHDISRSVTFWIYEPQTHQLGGTITPYIARH